jgi:hypothetical protein
MWHDYSAVTKVLKLRAQLFNDSHYPQGLTPILLNSRLKPNLALSPNEIRVLA